MIVQNIEKDMISNMIAIINTIITITIITNKITISIQITTIINIEKYMI